MINRDPMKQMEDKIKLKELEEMEKVVNRCKKEGYPAEVMHKLLEDNKKAFDDMREQYFIRGMIKKSPNLKRM